MILLKRRGLRQEIYRTAHCGRKCREMDLDLKKPTMPKYLEEYKCFVDAILHPSRKCPSELRREENIYASLSEREKENLICSIANQIQSAHPEVCAGCLNYLYRISTELGQKTEVALNRIRFSVYEKRKVID